MFPDPIEYGLVPLNRVFGFQHPVIFVREHEQFGFNTLLLQRCEGRKRL
jgi:hypothetical protein